MRLTRKPAPKRRNETRGLTHPIRVALNKLPGVRLARNNSGMLEDKRGVKLRYGLGTGSADLVGVCRCCYASYDHDVDHPCRKCIGRAFALEVKWPSEKPTEDQERWMSEVRKLGGFACVVTSVDEAIAAVARCRAGESQ